MTRTAGAHKVETFVDAEMEPHVVRFYATGADTGDPCVNICVEDLGEWLYALARICYGAEQFDDYGEEPISLPGGFGVLTDVDSEDAP